MTAAIPAGAGPVLPGSAPGRPGADPTTDATSVAFLAALSAVLPVPAPQGPATPAPATGPAGVPSAGALGVPAAAAALSAGPALLTASAPDAADPAPVAAAPGAPAPELPAPAGPVTVAATAGSVAVPSAAQAAGVQWLAPATPVAGPDATTAGAGAAAGTATTEATGRPRGVVAGQAPVFVPATPAAAFALLDQGGRQPAVETPAPQADPALPVAGVSGLPAAPGGGGEARDTGPSGSGDRPRTVLAPPVAPAFHPAAPTVAVDPAAPTTQAPAGPHELPHHQVMTAVSPLLRGPDGEQSLRLQLHPQDLGAVNVTVELRRGEVAIHLHAADGAAADLLRDHLPDLRQQLEDQGLRAGALQVDTGSAGSAGQGSARQQPLRPDLPAPERTPVPAGPTSHPTTAPAAAGALDLRM